MTDYSAELGHVQLEVADLERSTSFYARFLGFRVTERMESRKGRVVLLSGGERHRELSLRAAPPRGPRANGAGDAGSDGSGEDRAGGPGPAMSAPFQIAFEVPDREAFADLLFELRKEGVPTTAMDHGVSWALHFRDPDGHALQAYWDTRGEEGGRSRWEGRSRLLALHQVLSEEEVRELARIREGDAGGDDGEEQKEGEEGDAAARGDEDAAASGDEVAGDGDGEAAAEPDPAGDRSASPD